MPGLENVHLTVLVWLHSDGNQRNVLPEWVVPQWPEARDLLPKPLEFEGKKVTFRSSQWSGWEWKQNQVHELQGAKLLLPLPEWGTRQVCHVPSLCQAGETVSWRRGKPGLLPYSVFRLQLYSFLGMEPETQKFTEELKGGLTDAKRTLLWSTCFSAQRRHSGLPLNTFRKCVADELKQNNKTTGNQLRG